MISKDHILAEIRRTAAENGGKALGTQRFEAATGIRIADWSGRYWTRWGDALTEAGFSPNSLQGRYDDDAVMLKLVTETRRLGHLPNDREMRMIRRADPTFPSTGVFEKFGARAQVAAMALDYCARNPEWADVAPLIEAHVAKPSPATRQPASSDEDLGFVYLLRSGHHYKVGKSNAFGRRERELAIQLPERAQTVHVIKTDDPAGIEAYWHRRFADRRKNGEWFDLTAADVAAFRRRKFM